METIGINTMASKSKRVARIFILPEILVGFSLR